MTIFKSLLDERGQFDVIYGERRHDVHAREATEPDMDLSNRECRARELSEAVGHFVKRATESEIPKIRDILIFAEERDTTLSSAIIKAMRRDHGAEDRWL